MQSEQINELAAALSKAQGSITGALKDSANPFFKSRYADLASCWDACRKQLSDNGLAVIQTTYVEEGLVIVRTTLVHSSGQWIDGELPVRAKDDSPQAQGSGITYARRYALAAIVGLAQIDDDANAAQGRETMVDPAVKVDTKLVNKYSEAIIAAVNKGSDDGVIELMDEIKTSDQAFRAAVWVSLPKPVKDHIKDIAPRAA